MCGHWVTIVDRLLAFAKLHAADAIPDKAGYELAELGRLGKEKDLGDIKRSEALRILGRKRARRGQEKMAQETFEKLAALIGEDPVALGHEIAIASLLAKAKAEAEALPVEEGEGT